MTNERKIALSPTHHIVTVQGDPARRWHGRTAGGIEVDVFCSGIVAWHQQDGDKLVNELGVVLGTVDTPRGNRPTFSGADAELHAYRQCVAALLQCRVPNGPPGSDDVALRGLLVSTFTANTAALVIRHN